jgi:hypothetical protein
MTEIDSRTYLLSKIQKDFLSLSDKIEFSSNFIQQKIMKKMEQYIHSNIQMPDGEYSKVFSLIINVHDDIILTINNEIKLIKGYFTDGLVESDDCKLNYAHNKYLEKRTEYFNIHEKAIKMCESSLHKERKQINTSIMQEPCSICSAKHGKAHALILSCGHSFGIKCFNKWADVCINNNNNVNCPLCRELNV